ncbi:hypothetical protein HKD37_10G027490 [Glycine soja]
MQNQETQVGKSYSKENYQWEQELQPYNQYEEERTSNMDNLLMQFKEVTESTQQAFKSLEIQVEEHDSKEKDEEKSEEKTKQWEKYSQVEIQQESIIQVNTPPHQLIVKEERHGEHEKALSVILSLITSTSLAMMWKVLPEYMSFMESLAKRMT